MKWFKKMAPILAVLLACWMAAVPSLADAEPPAIVPCTPLFINYARLTATDASASGGSTQMEEVTVSLTLYDGGGHFITSGSATGLGSAVVSRAVNLSPGEYRLVVAVSNGQSTNTRAFYPSI